MACPFCALPLDTLVFRGDLIVAFRDRFPVTPGHTLIIPRRHVETYFQASEEERGGLWSAVEEVKRSLDTELHPDGYNVGFNAGRAAGQTVMHLHVHVIPRFHGDMPDPRGGVRGVIPEKQNYGVGDADVAGMPSDPFGDLIDFSHGEDCHLLKALHVAMRRADRIDFLSAFVQVSGLEAIEDHMIDALRRGAHIRLLTGDYLGITDPYALQKLHTMTTGHSNLEVRLFDAGARPFHPKAYLFRYGEQGVAFVGSSNLSRGALTDSVEWNLRAASIREPATFARIAARFDALWHMFASRPLTLELVSEYQSRVMRVPPAPEPAPKRPEAHGVQREVLKLLEESRDEGARRGLVVMATGLGKTYLAAFDFAQMRGERLLFVAHREEILEQAVRTFARLFPDRSRGLMKGERRELNEDMVFASIQTLARENHLRGIARRHFDYIVIDEFHHAAADTYLRVLRHFEPRFLLGITATPDRMDGAALFDLCDNNLVARVGMVEGITRNLLVPFKYFGIKDDVDYRLIKFSAGRFVEEELTHAVATRARADAVLREYRKHVPEGPRRVLAFCVSCAHADQMAAFFNEQGIPAASVHSASSSAPRAPTLDAFRNGHVEVLCAVDVFNEGLDVPDINVVLMLRPTESPVVFLQQLGRGLRKGDRIVKDALVVIDFIGNHRSFLRKPQALLALTGQEVPPGLALRLLRENQLTLPPGCSVQIDTEAIDMLERLSQLSKDDRLVYQYTMFKEAYGHRPRAADLFAAGVTFKPVKERHGTWHDFVRSQDDLTPEETVVLEAHRAWFRDLLTTPMDRSYKMVALQVLLDSDAISTGMLVADNAAGAKEYLLRDPVLQSELHEHVSGRATPDAFSSQWRKSPLDAFHKAVGFSRQWFRITGDRLESRLSVEPALEPAFVSMTKELVELRLREIKARHRYAAELAPLAPMFLRISHSAGNPCIRVDRQRRPDAPEGDVTVLFDDDLLTVSFGRISARVAVERPGGPNVLPTRMRRWFGAGAGLPGTRHEVLLERAADSWRLRPHRQSDESAEVIPFPKLPFFENLRVACGAVQPMGDGAEQRRGITVESSIMPDPSLHFIVRAEGDSMNGGQMPIEDGDLVLCSWTEAVRPEDVEGKVCLLAGTVGADLAFAQIKIPIRVSGSWVLRSANPSFPDQPVQEGASTRVVARVVEVVHSAVGFQLWGLYDRSTIAIQFGETYDRQWQQGHLDLELNGRPHSLLLVTLHKTSHMGDDYHYADRFLSRSEFQWESQNQTGPSDRRGRAIIEHRAQGRTVHLFVRFHGKTKEQKGEAFVYCGPVIYERHQGEKPMRVWFRLENELPSGLFRGWVE